jgi:hypothetical protein
MKIFFGSLGLKTRDKSKQKNFILCIENLTKKEDFFAGVLMCAGTVLYSLLISVAFGRT